MLVNGEAVGDPDVSADRLLGLTVFETIALRGGEPVEAEAHMERLARGARTLALGPLGGWEAVDDHVETALARAEVEEGILRVSLHARGEPVGLHMEDRQADVQVQVTPARYGDLSEGVVAVTASIRAPGEAWPAHVKAPCLPRILAHREARGRNAFEALMLDEADRVVSGTRSNVFALFGDELVTPPSPPAFPGITRRHVRDVAETSGLSVRVRGLERSELEAADELLLTFTGPGVVPVVELDGDPIHGGQSGPRARELAEALAVST